MISMHFTPSASPDSNRSFVTISKEAVSTVIDAESLDRVCFKLEKSRSTEIPTPGMTRMSERPTP
jgi:hypothetical protein